MPVFINIGSRGEWGDELLDQVLLVAQLQDGIKDPGMKILYSKVTGVQSFKYI